MDPAKRMTPTWDSGAARTHVNLKRGSETLGSFGYDVILDRLKQELDALIAGRAHEV